jgi:hypothetical protein
VRLRCAGCTVQHHCSVKPGHGNTITIKIETPLIVLSRSTFTKSLLVCIRVENLERSTALPTIRMYSRPYIYLGFDRFKSRFEVQIKSYLIKQRLELLFDYFEIVILIANMLMAKLYKR